jgi:Tfp pilus assembly protein PilN
MKPNDITGICRTDTSVEWTRLSILQNEQVAEPTRSEPMAENGAFPESLPAQLKGRLVSGLPASTLLQHILTLPTTDPDEIAGMVELQIDKMAPYPVQQMVVSHEILHQTDTHSRILVAAVLRETVKKMGETFKAAGLSLLSLDSNLFCRWKQIAEPAEPSQACLILEKGEAGLVIAQDGIPILLRSLHANADNGTELLEEIEYALSTLEHEVEIGEIETLHLWSDQPHPSLEKQLAANISLNSHDLAEIPTLSEALARRSSSRRLELVPRDWLETEKNRVLIRKLCTFTAALIGLWLAVIVVFSTAFYFHKSSVLALRKEAEALSKPAAAVHQDSRKVSALRIYTDQTHSALEALREVSTLLPDGIELSIFSYKKGSALTLRGEARNSDAIYQLFDRLAEAPFFSEIKDQSVTSATRKGGRISEFSLVAIPAGVQP